MHTKLPILIPYSDAVRKFKEIYDARFGGDLYPEKALELATYCLLLVWIGTHTPPIEIIPPRCTIGTNSDPRTA